MTMDLQIKHLCDFDAKPNQLSFRMCRYFSVLKLVVMTALPGVKVLDLRNYFTQNDPDLDVSMFSKNIK